MNSIIQLIVQNRHDGDDGDDGDDDAQGVYLIIVGIVTIYYGAPTNLLPSFLAPFLGKRGRSKEKEKQE